MYISDYVGAGVKGHRNLDFVDVNLDDDTSLFIDPCLIELMAEEDIWCRDAQSTISAFIDCLYACMRNGTLQNSGLLAHASEINAPHLGYGDGNNGKGKTEAGMLISLSGLTNLTRQIPSISKIQDMSVLVRRFAEDNMSDLLLNILHEQINRFTSEQMQRWSVSPTGRKTIWTFSAETRGWIQVERPCWEYNEKEILLIPKCIVRKNYLFKTHQYLYSVIADRMRRENGWFRLTKRDILANIPKANEHWEYETVISYTKANPEALTEYHNRMPRFYLRANAIMSDDDLDQVVYGYIIEELA